jgi:hypothetical protein
MYVYIIIQFSLALHLQLVILYCGRAYLICVYNKGKVIYAFSYQI